MFALLQRRVDQVAANHWRIGIEMAIAVERKIRVDRPPSRGPHPEGMPEVVALVWPAVFVTTILASLQDAILAARVFRGFPLRSNPRLLSAIASRSSH